MNKAALPQRDAIISEWIDAIHRLFEQVSEWVRDQPDWDVDSSSAIEVEEESLGSYVVPVLTIRLPNSKTIRLEPIARIVFGGQGTVEMLAWPSLFRVRLVRGAKDGEWTVLTDSGIKLRQPWNKETFVTLAEDLAAVGE